MWLKFISCFLDSILEEIVQVMVFTVKLTNDFQEGIVDFAQNIYPIAFLDQVVGRQAINFGNVGTSV